MTNQESGVCERLVASCRVCLRSRGVLNIFVPGDTLAKLRVCTPIQIEENDGLPHSLCRKCAKKLEDAYSFRKECEHSDRRLHWLRRAKALQTKVEFKVELKDEVNICTEDEIKVSPSELLQTNKVEMDTKRDLASILKWLGARPDLQIKGSAPHSLCTYVKAESEIKEIKEKKQNEIVQGVNDKPELSVLPNDIYVIEVTDVDEDDIPIEHEEPPKLNNYQCDYCAERFIDHIEFERHVMAHKNETYYCDLCKKTFMGTKRIEIHKMVHKDRRLPCEFCGKLYDRLHLKNHVTRTHINKLPSLQTCALCDKVLSSLHKLDMHYMTRHRNKPVQCDHCGKTCTTKMGLAQHIERVHTRSRPHVCTHCGKRFASRTDCRQHERLHTGIRPYTCPLCNEAYAQRCNMKSHFKHNHKEFDFREAERLKKLSE